MLPHGQRVRVWAEGLVILKLWILPWLRSKHFLPQLKMQHFLLSRHCLSFVQISLSLNSHFSRILGHLPRKRTVLQPWMLEGTVPTLLPTRGNSGESGKLAFSLLIQRRPFLQGVLMYFPTLPTLLSLLTTIYSLNLLTPSLVPPPTLFPLRRDFSTLPLGPHHDLRERRAALGTVACRAASRASFHWMPIAVPS